MVTCLSRSEREPTKAGHQAILRTGRTHRKHLDRPLEPSAQLETRHGSPVVNQIHDAGCRVFFQGSSCVRGQRQSSCQGLDDKQPVCFPDGLPASN